MPQPHNISTMLSPSHRWQMVAQRPVPCTDSKLGSGTTLDLPYISWNPAIFLFLFTVTEAMQGR